RLVPLQKPCSAARLPRSVSSSFVPGGLMRPWIVAGILLLGLAPGIEAQATQPFGTLRDQAAVRQSWLEARLERVLPRLMREQGVDMWIVPVREYNEDPVFWSLVSPATMAARRRTIYVFFDRGDAGGVERIA